jgi:hypothetical protein
MASRSGGLVHHSLRRPIVRSDILTRTYSIFLGPYLSKVLRLARTVAYGEPAYLRTIDACLAARALRSERSPPSLSESGRVRDGIVCTNDGEVSPIFRIGRGVATAGLGLARRLRRRARRRSRRAFLLDAVVAWPSIDSTGTAEGKVKVDRVTRGGARVLLILGVAISGDSSFLDLIRFLRLRSDVATPLIR